MTAPPSPQPVRNRHGDKAPPNPDKDPDACWGLKSRAPEKSASPSPARYGLSAVGRGQGEVERFPAAQGRWRRAEQGRSLPQPGVGERGPCAAAAQRSRLRRTSGGGAATAPGGPTTGRRTRRGRRSGRPGWSRSRRRSARGRRKRGLAGPPAPPGAAGPRRGAKPSGRRAGSSSGSGTGSDFRFLSRSPPREAKEEAEVPPPRARRAGLGVWQPPIGRRRAGRGQ